jgi:hypothetical protein
LKAARRVIFNTSADLEMTVDSKIYSLGRGDVKQTSLAATTEKLDTTIYYGILIKIIETSPYIVLL